MKPNYDGAKYSKKKKLGINFTGRGSKSGNNNVEAQENTEKVGDERESGNNNVEAQENTEKVGDERETVMAVRVTAARKDVLQKSGL